MVSAITKPTNKGFTLVETIVTLVIVTLIMLLGWQGMKLAQVRPTKPQFEANFDAHWQSMRAQAQRKGQVEKVEFRDGVVVFGRDKVDYPGHFRLNDAVTVKILPTGYVAPQTIHLEDGQEEFKIVFSLGGGDYRFQG